ncbi:MAG: tetratricopeptide repeat protein [Saprospiraceae bacterium]
MEKQKLINIVRELVGQAEPDQALEQLIPFLQNDPEYQDLAKLAYLAQAKLERNRRDKDSGTITRENANLTENLVFKTILNITNDLESDNFHPKRYEIQGSRISGNLLKVLTGIFILLAIGLGTWLYITFREEPEIVDASECPPFDPQSEFNILLLPFETIAGENMQTHISIKRRLADKIEQSGINVDIEIFKDYFENDAHDTPTATDAREIGESCTAKLVIWGTTESVEKGKIVSTSYKYIGEQAEQLMFRKIRLESRNRIDTITTLSSIETEGILTQDIEKIIYTIFGLVANRTQNHDAAIAILEEANDSTLVQDSATVLLNNMLLADSYIAKDSTKKAEQTYDKILAVHPDYGFALNNRGILKLKNNRYVEAIEDFNKKLELSPDDADALAARGAAFLKLDELERAEQDFQKAGQIVPASPVIQESKTRLDSVKHEKMQQKARATEEINQNSNNIEALNKRADASVTLGDPDQAIRDANKVLRKDSRNVEAYANLSEAYLRKGDTTEVKAILNRAVRKGVDIKDIEAVRPLVVDFIKKKKRN